MPDLVNPKTGRRHRLVPRSESGLRAPRHRVSLRSTKEGTFEHWAVTGPATDVGTGSAIMRAIQRFHMDSKGWSDFAYSFGYDDAGVIYEGRGWGIAGGHTLGYNADAHAFVYLGGALKPGGGRYEPTPDALAALFALEAHEDALYGAGKPHRPHRRVSQTGCPGDVITGYVEGSLGILLDSPTPGAPQPPAPAPSACRYVHQGDRMLRLASPMQRGRDVAEWQFLLNYANGPDRSHWLTVDGVFGPKTSQETKRLQSIYGFFFRPIAVDGVVGPKTREALCDVLRAKGIW